MKISKLQTLVFIKHVFSSLLLQQNNVVLALGHHFLPCLIFAIKDKSPYGAAQCDALRYCIITNIRLGQEWLLGNSAKKNLVFLSKKRQKSFKT